jgi:hypothetical protein
VHVNDIGGRNDVRGACARFHPADEVNATCDDGRPAFMLIE